MSDLWLLTSSDGWNKFTGKIIDKWINPEKKPLLLADVSINGVFWERNKSVKHSNLLPDFSVNLHQVVITKTGLKNLISDLEEWMVSTKEISVELSGVGHQSLRLELGEDTNYICSPDKPVCKVLYSGERMVIGRWDFIVDQSCIYLFKEDLIRVNNAFF